MVQYYVSSNTEEDANEVGGARDWNSDADDLAYENSPADLEDDDGNPGLQQDLNANFGEDYHKYPRRTRKWISLYSPNDSKFPERARTINSTYDEEKLKHPEMVNEMLMAANNEEHAKYPEDESGLSPTYDEEDLKCLEEAKALSSAYDDFIEQTDQANANLEEDALKYPEPPQGPTRSLFQEASPEFRIERSLQGNRIYLKPPKFLDQTKEQGAHVGSAGSRRAFSPQRRQQPPAALKTFGAVSRRLYSARSPPPAADAPHTQASKWSDEGEAGAREALKRTRNTLLKDLEGASVAGSGAGAGAHEVFAPHASAPLAPARRESPMLSQRRTRSISTSRTPSLPASSLRPSSRAQPEAARPSSARPCAAEDAGLDQNARRNLYMKYSYVPSWVFLAKRHENLFSKVIDYFFKHNAWPDFHKLPEAFRNVCAQYSVEAHHMKRMPGFAPVWLFALRKLDHRYFRATVDHFFDHKAFPHWSWLPREFVRQFEELGVHERHYFT